MVVTLNLEIPGIKVTPGREGCRIRQNSGPSWNVLSEALPPIYFLPVRPSLILSLAPRRVLVGGIRRSRASRASSSVSSYWNFQWWDKCRPLDLPEHIRSSVFWDLIRTASGHLPSGSFSLRFPITSLVPHRNSFTWVTSTISFVSIVSLYNSGQASLVMAQLPWTFFPFSCWGTELDQDTRWRCSQSPGITGDIRGGPIPHQMHRLILWKSFVMFSGKKLLQPPWVLIQYGRNRGNTNQVSPQWRARKSYTHLIVTAMWAPWTWDFWEALDSEEEERKGPWKNRQAPWGHPSQCHCHSHLPHEAPVPFASLGIHFSGK